MWIAASTTGERISPSRKSLYFSYDLAGIGLSHVSLDGKYLLVNRKLCEILHYSSEELLQLHFQDITHPDDIELGKSNLRKLLEGSLETYTQEKRYLRKDGLFIWAKIQVALFRSPSEAPSYFVATVEEISHPKEVLKKITASPGNDSSKKGLRPQELIDPFKTIVENSPDMISVLKAQGHFSFASPSFQKILGYTEDEIIGRSFYDFCIPEEWPGFEESPPRFFHKAVVSPFTHKLRKKDGTYIWVESTYKVLRNPLSREVQEIICISREIGDRVALQQQMDESEKNLKSIFNTSELLMGILEVAGNDYLFVKVNPASEKYLNRPLSEIENKWATELGRPKEVIQTWLKYCRASEESRRPYYFDYQVRGKKEVHWFSASINFIGHSPSGRPRFSCVVSNVTQRIQLEEQLRFHSEVTALLGETLDPHIGLAKLARLLIPKYADLCSIDILEENGKIQNKLLAHYDPEKESFLKKIRETFPWRDNPQVPSHEVIRNGHPMLLRNFPSQEIFSQIACDEKHCAMLMSLNIQSALIVPLISHGRILGAITLASTQKDRLYDDKSLAFAQEWASKAALAYENSVLYKKAEKAIEQKNELLSIVSHDLKNPLAAITVSASLLPKLAQSASKFGVIAKVAKNITSASNRMMSLVNDLLDVGALEAGDLVLDMQKASSLKSVLLEAIEILQPLADTKNLKIIMKMNEECIAAFDPRRIYQVFSNLIGNSIKFSPPGGSITLSVIKLEKEIQCSVLDEGPGIETSHLEKIFDRYWKSNKDHQGTGLGLAIAKGLVEAHGGRIWAESNGTQGTKMTFTLPLSSKPN